MELRALSTRLANRMSRRRAVRLMLGGAAASGLALAIAGTATSTPAEAATDNSCNCVLWVQSQTGLRGGPGTAAGYTERAMNDRGYKKVGPTNGAIMVWDANQKGAYGSGHMAIVSGNPSYNSKTKKWSITVRHANWGGCGIRTTTFNNWGDLYGINFYVRK